MNSLVNSMLSGTGAKTCHIYVSLLSMIHKYPWLASLWSRGFSPSLLPGWACSVSRHLMRCGDLARNVAPSGNRRSPAVDPSTTDKPVAIRMANDPRYRSSRPERLSQDRPSGDPLSELARLIGQDDAVVGTARNSASRRQRDPGDREESPPRRGN